MSGGRPVAAAGTSDGQGPLIFLAAGEASGDSIGGLLMTALRDRLPGRVRFAGIGGDAMTAAGLRSLFPMTDLAVMGLVEVIPHIRRLVRRIDETVAAIDHLRPQVVVTIDAPGFNLRVARALRRRMGADCPLLVHYVAPTVWAWRPKRAARLARLYDHLLVLLPFEPPWFVDEGLPTTFVGHPAIETTPSATDRARLRRDHRRRAGVADESPLLCLLPGSRRGEVRRLLPVFRDAVDRTAAAVPGLRVVLPTVTGVETMVRQAVSSWRLQPDIMLGAAARSAAFAAADVALAASGTVALETAMAGLPTVVGYRANPLTVAIVRRLVTVRYVNLVNILLDRPVIPERLQQACRPAVLADDLVRLLCDPAAAGAQRRQFETAASMLAPDGAGGLPSTRAADALLDVIRGRVRPAG